MNRTIITHQNYDYKAKKVTWSEIRENPEKYGYTEESVKLQTVPGQAVSIKEIMKRYENGRPQPTTD